ncbi:MAG: hypothetical protein Ct9H300mP26_4290 [Acidimicrobiales bacterium]|nr:MAG: hypothetical protein Ct9H300mP26_4290 [Acidimicrobiales bacterium]
MYFRPRTLTEAPIEVVSWTNEEGHGSLQQCWVRVFGGEFSLEDGLGATAQEGRLVDELPGSVTQEATLAGVDPSAISWNPHRAGTYS